MSYYHLAELIHRNAEKYGDKTALNYFDRKQKKWKNVSWNHFSEKIMRTAWAMAEIGISTKERIGIYSQNMRQYLYTDFAIYANRAVMIPIYATSSPSQVEYIVNDADMHVLFAGEQFQYNNAFKVQQQSQVLKKIIVFDPNVVFHPEDKTSIYFDDFIASGENSNTQVVVNVRMNSIRPEDIACIMYTSGTTGEPKGAILHHYNFMEILRIHDIRLPMASQKDLSMCFLPLAHIFEKGWTYFALHKGMTIAVNHDPKEIQKSVKQLRPTIMCSVPRFWEKVYAGVNDIIDNSKAPVKWIFKDAIKTGKRYNLDYYNKGLKAPLGNSIKFIIYKNTVFRLLKTVIGIERGNIYPCAGAPLSNTINEFLHSVDIPILYGYGLTETSATVSCFIMPGFTFGTVGTVMDGIDVKIGENDEILVKGRTVMSGYYNKPEATAAAFTEDGYFRTGDAGRLTEKNEIILTERIKDLFKTANGKYIAPQAIEIKLQEDKYIDQAAIIADKRKYVSALIVPDFEQLKEYAARHNISYSDNKDLVENKEIHTLIANRIEYQVIDFASYEKVKRFTILSHPFSMEDGELTNTLKIKRRVVEEKYADLISAMYDEALSD
ncbi:MAG: long-chain fatty acid--CoA ligase [Dysgonamonadaceae bacterium]